MLRARWGSNAGRWARQTSRGTESCRSTPGSKACRHAIKSSLPMGERCHSEPPTPIRGLSSSRGANVTSVKCVFTRVIRLPICGGDRRPRIHTGSLHRDWRWTVGGCLSDVGFGIGGDATGLIPSAMTGGEANHGMKSSLSMQLQSKVGPGDGLFDVGSARKRRSA